MRRRPVHSGVLLAISNLGQEFLSEGVEFSLFPRASAVYRDKQTRGMGVGGVGGVGGSAVAASGL